MAKKDTKLVKGDRVEIIETGIWPPQYSKMATVWGPFDPNTTGAGKDRGVGTYPIRIDDYDYGDNRDNCHTVNATAIKLSEPTDDEILALFGLSK